MSLETDLMSILLTVCPRVHVGTAPYGTQMPYVTWQHIGGDPLDFLDNTVADKRNAQIQVNTWAGTPLQAFSLIQAIEAALRASVPIFIARPLSEPIGAYGDGDTLPGYLQSYSITGAR